MLDLEVDLATDRKAYVDSMKVVAIVLNRHDQTMLYLVGKKKPLHVSQDEIKLRDKVNAAVRKRQEGLCP